LEVAGKDKKGKITLKEEVWTGGEGKKPTTRVITGKTPRSQWGLPIVSNAQRCGVSEPDPKAGGIGGKERGKLRTVLMAEKERGGCSRKEQKQLKS